MPTQLPNLGLNIGSQGEADWHIFLNENFEILDFDFVYPLEYDSSTKQVRFAADSFKTIFSGGTGADQTSGTSADEYLPANGIAATSTVESDVHVLMPIGGTAATLRIWLSSAPGTGQTRTFKLRVNGVDTALAVTISGASTTGVDTTNEVTIAAGDRVSIESSTANSPTLTKVAFGWVLQY